MGMHPLHGWAQQWHPQCHCALSCPLLRCPHASNQRGCVLLELSGDAERGCGAGAACSLQGALRALRLCFNISLWSKSLKERCCEVCSSTRFAALGVLPSLSMDMISVWCGSICTGSHPSEVTLCPEGSAFPLDFCFSLPLPPLTLPSSEHPELSSGQGMQLHGWTHSESRACSQIKLCSGLAYVPFHPVAASLYFSIMRFSCLLELQGFLKATNDTGHRAELRAPLLSLGLFCAVPSAQTAGTVRAEHLLSKTRVCSQQRDYCRG